MSEKSLILVVDDEYSNRLLLEELLQEYEVVSADGGDAMWRILDVRHPDLILMDVMMPYEDGFVLAEKIYKINRLKDIPIIFVTAKVGGKDIETGFDVGGVDYIKKPFNQLELETRVRKAIGSKRAEKELQKKAFTADKIIETMSDGMLLLDRNQRIFDANPASCTMLEFWKEELIGIEIQQLIKGSLNFEEQATSKSTLNVETIVSTKLKREIPVILAVSTIFDECQQTVGWACVIHDISKQKQTEQNLIDAKNKAEQADKLKSAFLANMSHEIRTPMNSIVGFSELLEDPELSLEERLEYVNIIQKNSDKLLNFMDNLLDISIIESGQIQIKKSNCRINGILDELLTSFSILKIKQERENIDLRLKKASSDNSFSIYTDSYRLQQIIINLVGNALKFTKEGWIEFGYSLEPDNIIRFYVQDTGVGIPNDKLAIIFDRFGQVEHKNINNNSGTGLGLAISKNLAELLGGILSVESTPGVGSLFYFDIKL